MAMQFTHGDSSTGEYMAVFLNILWSLVDKNLSFGGSKWLWEYAQLFVERQQQSLSTYHHFSMIPL